jgi:hypothetical protein
MTVGMRESKSQKIKMLIKMGPTANRTLKYRFGLIVTVCAARYSGI